jgi:hypothetical protein
MEKIAKLYISKIPKPPMSLPVPPPLPFKESGAPPLPGASNVPPAPIGQEKLPDLPGAGPPKPPAPSAAIGMPAPPILPQQLLKGSDIPPPPVTTLTGAEIARKVVMAFLPDSLKFKVKSSKIQD